MIKNEDLPQINPTRYLRGGIIMRVCILPANQKTLPYQEKTLGEGRPNRLLHRTRQRPRAQCLGFEFRDQGYH
jgi:hypothetical protein